MARRNFLGVFLLTQAVVPTTKEVVVPMASIGAPKQAFLRKYNVVTEHHTVVCYGANFGNF